MFRSDRARARRRRDRAVRRRLSLLGPGVGGEHPRSDGADPLRAAPPLPPGCSDLTALARVDGVTARFVGDFRSSDREWAANILDRMELIPYAPHRRSLEDVPI